MLTKGRVTKMKEYGKTAAALTAVKVIGLDDPL